MSEDPTLEYLTEAAEAIRTAWQSLVEATKPLGDAFLAFACTPEFVKWAEKKRRKERYQRRFRRRGERMKK